MSAAIGAEELITLPADAPLVAGVASTVEPPQKSTSAVRGRHYRRMARQVLLLGVTLGAAVLIFEFLVVDLMEQQRQNHLAAEFAQPRANLPSGAAAAVLQIPALAINEYVIQGDSVSNLRAGPAHDAATPLPGKLGNAIIVGHHSRYGAPLDHLGRLKPGDEIYIRIRGAPSAFVYVVQSVERPRGSTSALLAPSSDARLTLVTGTGGRLAGNLLIVQAVTDSTVAKPAAKPVDLHIAGEARFPALIAADLVLLAGALAFLWLRKRYLAWVAYVVSAPFLALALVGILLFLDQLVPPVT